MNEYVRDPLAFAGRVETRPFQSEALAGNRIGDPSAREVPVYVPPGDARFPVVFVLAGFTSRGQSMLDTHPWHRGVVSRYDEAVARGDAPPAILVLPDAFTRLGGSQYVNSSLLGKYEDYVARELVEWVDATYPTRPGRRAVVGKSSGGFGALRLGMRHPETFPVAASISGDCNFEFGYGSELLAAVRGLDAYERDPAQFLEAFLAKPDLSGDGHAVIDVIAMSACYSPNPESPWGFDLPMDLETGERVPEVWERWLAFDPVVACEEYADALKRLEYLYFEAGRKDEFHLQLGARILCRKLRSLGVPFEYEEHDGGHFGLDERYMDVLPKVVSKLG